MFLRALLAFLALPVVVGGLVPWLLVGIDRWRSAGTPWGWPVFSLGAIVLLWCVRDFYVVGKGTLAPWDPPKILVIVGLYRFIRNPMYVGVLALGFHLRVILYEEPRLARQFGNGWTEYRTAVGRWLPRLKCRVSRGCLKS